MENENTKADFYLKVIDEIEKIRTNNNVNWMDILRLAFIHAPNDAKKLMKRINQEDKKITELFQKLTD